MSRFELKLNGTDVSRMLHKWGVSYTMVKVRGVNGGVSQGGVVIEDVLRTKDLFTFRGNSVEDADWRQLCALCDQNYATAEYRSPRTGETGEHTVMLELSGDTIAHMNGRIWHSGWSLTMEER